MQVFTGLHFKAAAAKDSHKSAQNEQSESSHFASNAVPGGRVSRLFRVLLLSQIGKESRVNPHRRQVQSLRVGRYPVHQHSAAYRVVGAGDDVRAVPADDLEVPHLEALALVKVVHLVIQVRARGEEEELFKHLRLVLRRNHIFHLRDAVRTLHLCQRIRQFRHLPEHLAAQALLGDAHFLFVSLFVVLHHFAFPFWLCAAPERRGLIT